MGRELRDAIRTIVDGFATGRLRRDNAYLDPESDWNITNALTVLRRSVEGTVPGDEGHSPISTIPSHCPLCIVPHEHSRSRKLYDKAEVPL